MIRKGRFCAVCGVREKNRGGFFASFPSNESRCKEWVKLVGNEDLIHLPIEKLCRVRHICGDHFKKSDFIRKGSRLKKTAVPCVELLAPPLSDDQLIEFPLHNASYKAPEITENSSSGKQLESTLAIDNTADDAMIMAPREFSWQRPPEAIPCAGDVEIQTDVSLTAPDSPGGDSADDRRPIESYNDRLHLGYKCNECGSEIVGYRYTCVQCCDLDLCGACEASGAHPEHYVLRLPRPELAGAFKGVLETLRSLLDHEPLSQLDLDKVKKEEDEDPLIGLQPLAPISLEEPDDFGPKGQEVKSVLEMLPNDSKYTQETDTDITVANTAQVQHQTNVDSSNKVSPIIQNSSPVKKLLLSVVRVKKPTEGKPILNSDVVELISSKGPVAPAVMGTGVRISGADVTNLGDCVRLFRAGVRVSKAKVTVPRAKVAVPEAAMKLLRTGVTVPRAGVSLLRIEAGVTVPRTQVSAWRAGVVVSGTGVRESEAGVTEQGAGVTVPRTQVSAWRAGVVVSGTGVRESEAGVTEQGAGVTVPRTQVSAWRAGVVVSGTGVRESEAGVTEQGAGVTVPRTQVSAWRAGVVVSGTGVRDSEAGVTEQGAGVTVPRTQVSAWRAGVVVSGAGVRESEAGVTEQGAGVTVPRTQVSACRAGVVVSGAGVRESETAVTEQGAGVSVPRTQVSAWRAGVVVSGAGVRESEAGVTEQGAGVTVPRTQESAWRAGVVVSGAGVRESEAGVTEQGAGVTVPRTQVSVLRAGVRMTEAVVGMSGASVGMSGAGVMVSVASVRVSRPAPKGATVVNVERLETIEPKGTKRRKLNDTPESE